MRIDLIAGARPNFMKIAPIAHALESARSQGHNISCRIIHTGQHYDRNMSEQFFEELRIPEPDVNLGAGGGTAAQQTSAIMTRYEELLMRDGLPALCVVVGDVTSTMACSIAAKKLGVRVAHVEGGIRSRDYTMPEEINRVVTDSITDYFFTTSRAANGNLAREGVGPDRIFFVGNTMIDTLHANLDRLRKPAIWDRLPSGVDEGGEPGSLQAGRYFVMTLHRPANVDREETLAQLLEHIARGTLGEPVIFPAHPRTRQILERLNLSWPHVHYVDPMGYLEFLYLVRHARAVITDSGGITEETTVLGVPCLTLRDNTERPETVTLGTNELLGTGPDALRPALQRLMAGSWKKGEVPDLWDGKAAERIVQSILELASTGGLEPHMPFVDADLIYKP